MLREVPNCESTHAGHGCDDHSRGWRTYVAVICDYIMVSLGSSRGQRQHGGREISFVSRRAAPCRATFPTRRRRASFPRAAIPTSSRRRRHRRSSARHVSFPTYFVTGARLDTARRFLETRTTLSVDPPRIFVLSLNFCRLRISR